MDDLETGDPGGRSRRAGAPTTTGAQGAVSVFLAHCCKMIDGPAGQGESMPAAPCCPHTALHSHGQICGDQRGAEGPRDS